MARFIIINLFGRSGVWIWNSFIVRFNWKLWRVNLNIPFINGVIIKSPRGSWKHRDLLGRRCPVFEVSCWRLAVPLSWWLNRLFTITGSELIHLYYKTWWAEFRAMDEAGISLVYNSSTVFANSPLSHAEICNNYRERCYIIFDGRWRDTTMRVLTWSGQCSWSSYHL